MAKFPLGVLPETFEPYLALLLAGFLIGIFGHIVRSRWMVAIGVIMIMLAALVFPLILQLLSDEPSPPGPQIPPIGL